MGATMEGPFRKARPFSFPAERRPEIGSRVGGDRWIRRRRVHLEGLGQEEQRMELAAAIAP